MLRWARVEFSTFGAARRPLLWTRNSTLPTKPVSPAIAALAGWLVPGLGHIYIGRRTRGLVVMVVLLATFFLGAALGRFENVWWTGHRWLYVGCQVWAGAPAVTLFAKTAIRPPEGAPGVTRKRHYNKVAEMGAICTQIVGLLNLLAFTDAWAKAYRMSHPAKEKG